MTVMAAFRLQITPLLCLFAMCAAAQELTEKQVLRLFRESPYRLELQAGVEVMRAKAERHRLYPNPSVSATFEGAGRTDFFVVEQMFALNGRRGLLRQAGDSAVRVEETRAEHTLRQIEAQLRSVFYQLAYAQNRKKAIGGSIGELEDLVRIMRVRERAGEGSRFDMLRAEREIVERESESAEADTMIAAAQARLASFLDGSVNPGTLIVNASLQPSYVLPDLSEALSDGLAARSDFRAETERLERWRLEAEAADRLRIPNPVVSGGLKRADIGEKSVNGPVLAISVDLPLFQKGRVEKGLAEAEANRTRARRRIVESQILADVRAAYNALRLRREIAKAYRIQAVGRAEELRDIARIAYQEGEQGILELLDGYRVSQQSKLRHLELLAAAKLAEVEFDRSVAKDLLP